jgi:histidinol-phosphatase (PHP family)
MAIHSNFHTHSCFSDGKETPEAFAIRAKEIGFQHLGFTEHAPVPFENKWSMGFDQMDEYVRVIDSLKVQYGDTTTILRGLEADFIPDVTYPFDFLRQRLALDYIIGSVHLVSKAGSGMWFIDGPDKGEYFEGLDEVFGGNVEEAVTAYYQQQIEMIRKEKFEILGHCDKVKMHNKGELFRFDEPWIRALQKALLTEVRKAGLIVEVNTRGIYKGRCDEVYPSPEMIAACVKEDIPLMLNSDAHLPEEIDGHFGETILLLKELKVKELMVYERNGFRPVSIE